MNKTHFVSEHYQDVVDYILDQFNEFVYSKTGSLLDSFMLDQEWHRVGKDHSYIGSYQEYQIPVIILTIHSFKGGSNFSIHSDSVIEEAYRKYNQGLAWKTQSSIDMIGDFVERDDELKAKEKEWARIAAINEFNLMDDGEIEHAYLVSKHLAWNSILRHGKDRFGDYIAAPIRTFNNETMTGTQKIYPLGWKKFSHGLQKKGCVIHVGTVNNELVYLAEGLADALTIHQITGEYTCAFLDVGNLDSLSDIVTQKRVVVVADNDKKRLSPTTGKPENIGVLKANAFFQKNKSQRRVIVPDVKSLDKVDVNDYYVHMGEKATRKLLNKGENS